MSELPVTWSWPGPAPDTDHPSPRMSELRTASLNCTVIWLSEVAAAETIAGASESGATDAALPAASMPLFEMSITASFSTYTVGARMSITFWRPASESSPLDDRVRDGSAKGTSLEEL